MHGIEFPNPQSFLIYRPFCDCGEKTMIAKVSVDLYCPECKNEIHDTPYSFNCQYIREETEKARKARSEEFMNGFYLDPLSAIRDVVERVIDERGEEK